MAVAQHIIEHEGSGIRLVVHIDMRMRGDERRITGIDIGLDGQAIPAEMMSIDLFHQAIGRFMQDHAIIRRLRSIRGAPAAEDDIVQVTIQLKVTDDDGVTEIEGEHRPNSCVEHALRMSAFLAGEAGRPYGAEDLILARGTQEGSVVQAIAVAYTRASTALNGELGTVAQHEA
ncbi:MAG: hypothetical protein H6591_10750 [Flavobacteriales bacterium]|nr:hypothetical protein [Flavobacteriales bacterium]